MRESDNFNSMCRSDCSICTHPLVVEIHEAKKDGKTLAEIVEIIQSKSVIPISVSSLSRHFAKTKEIISAEVVKQKYEMLKQETTKVLTYQVWTDKILERTFNRIWDNFEGLNIDISDLERLAKLRILLKEGDSSVGEGITDVFDKAAKKFGINMDQGKLFETEPKDPIKNYVDSESSPLPCTQGQGG